jgi:hypothetical protein
LAVLSDDRKVVGTVESSVAEKVDTMVDRSEQTKVDQWVAS